MLDPVAQPDSHLDIPGVEGMSVVNFDFDSSRLMSDDLEKLNKLMGQLDQDTRIEIVGTPVKSAPGLTIRNCLSKSDCGQELPNGKRCSQSEHCCQR